MAHQLAGAHQNMPAFFPVPLLLAWQLHREDSQPCKLWEEGHLLFHWCKASAVALVFVLFIKTWLRVESPAQTWGPGKAE